MIIRPRLAIDMDEVLKETFLALCGYHNATYGTTFTPNLHTQYDLTIAWEVSEEEKNRRLVEFYYSSHHDDAVPIEGAFEALTELERHFELHVVTARLREIEGLSKAWLQRHFPNLFAHVHHTGTLVDGRYVTIKKSDICKDIGAIALIDDSPSNIEEIITDLRISAYLFTAAHNKGVELPRGAVRVNSWPELARILIPT